MHLTHEMLRMTYELLRTTKPFARWKLPHADEVEFHVTNHKDRHGDHHHSAGAHRVRVSNRVVQTVHTLTLAMAHEMVHMRQVQVGAKRENHGPIFNRLADQVCRHHHFERGTF